ncbi:MAG: AAA family ATPase [Bryobacteraceae bacterium]|nr:AAA family ATPase [Bryobacteraceae bacterium]MDW8379483.1 AAA family ATPase [Bryobacterales bacterium]
MSISLLVASNDEQFRETVRENLLNLPNSRVISEYPEISSNLYIRVLQDLERHPEAALLLDMSYDTETALSALQKVKQAVPDLYVIVSNFQADGETVLACLRAGANDFLTQPLKRLEFRDAMQRLESIPRRVNMTGSRLGKIYTFVGAKGGVGVTTLAVNFASVLAQRKQQTVLLDFDWTANEVAMQVGATPQYTLLEVGENLNRMDQALFEGFVTRDPLGFFLVGPPDSLEQRGYFTEPMFREFATFLVEKYQSVVIDAGRNINDEVVLAALQASNTIFLVLNQEYPAIRNTQRYLSFLLRLGFSQDQIKILVNRYSKKVDPHHATVEQIQQTLNQKVFYGIPSSPLVLASINKARPLVSDRQAAGDWDRVFRAFVDKATGVQREAMAKSA